MITDKEYFIKIAGILAHSDIDENNCKYIIDFIIKQNSEISRLNNIINELEKYLEENIEYYSDDEYGLQLTDKGDYYTRILDKLKELKENNDKQD